MDSKTNIYRVYNKDKKIIFIIARSATQAIDIAALPRPEEEPHIKAQEAVVTSLVENYMSRGIKALLDSGEIGEIEFNEEQDLWFWKAPFYVLEYKYHGPFNSNQAAANYALNSGLPLTSKVLRM